MFPGLKSRRECIEEKIEFDPEAYLLNDEYIQAATLNTIVENIFRKAQLEKEYTIFYGKLCEEIIALELTLRGQEERTISNMRVAVFRKALLEFCRADFEKFFDAELRAQAYSTKEKMIIFQLKLFGNIEFIGELYRRKILPEAVINTVLEALLGMSPMNSHIDDLVVEGAINLMEKVGQAYE